MCINVLVHRKIKMTFWIVQIFLQLFSKKKFRLLIYRKLQRSNFTLFSYICIITPHSE